MIKMGFKQRELGDKAENQMKKFFRGEDNPLKCVDFETKTTLYEVKSCNLFNRCINCNNLRKPHHKVCETNQHGRYNILTFNHRLLKVHADSLNKKAKYIFCLRVGNNLVFQTRSWKVVSLIIGKTDKDKVYIPITKIYGEV